MELSQRKKQILNLMSNMIEKPYPLPDYSIPYSSNGFSDVPHINVLKELGGNKLLAHTEGGFWIACMSENSGVNYDDVAERLLEISKREVLSGKFRYIEVSDFLIMQLVRIYIMYKENLSRQMLDNIEKCLKEYEYAPYHEPMSENHKLCHLSSEIVAANLFPDELFYDGISGKDRLSSAKRSITLMLNKRLCNGWSEFDSASYYEIDICSLLNIYDFCNDTNLKQLAEKALNEMLIGYVAQSVNYRAAGAMGRVYPNTIIGDTCSMVWILWTLYGNIKRPDTDRNIGIGCAFVATSDFEPKKLILPQMPYDVYKRNSLYTIPDDMNEKGSVRRYGYITETYGMGCITSRDDYAENSMSAWLAGHQELSWCLRFSENPRAVIFSSHPGHSGLTDWGQHGFWTGDTNCLCGRYAQNKNILIGMNIITDPKQLQYIHFYFPKKEFDAVRESDGWIIAQLGRDCVALYITGGYYTNTNGEYADCELVSIGSKCAYSVEIFENKNIDDLELIKPKFDGEILIYKNIKLCNDRRIYIDNKKCDFSNYPLHSPLFMKTDTIDYEGKKT